MNIRALTFDLDDTLWDNRPVLMAAEQLLYDWLGRHYPRIKLHYSLEDMLKLRQNLLQKTPNCNMTSPHCAKLRCASQPKPPVMTTVWLNRPSLSFSRRASVSPLTVMWHLHYNVCEAPDTASGRSPTATPTCNARASDTCLIFPCQRRPLARPNPIRVCLRRPATVRTCLQRNSPILVTNRAPTLSVRETRG